MFAAAASFTPISPDFQLNLWSLVAVLIAVFALIDRFRRKPPLDSELVQLKASIDALQKSVDALTTEQKKHAGHDAKITELEKQVHELRGLRESDGQSQRSYIAKLSREIFDKIDGQAAVSDTKFDALTSTINREFRDLYRALGKAEGQLAHE